MSWKKVKYQSILNKIKQTGCQIIYLYPTNDNPIRKEFNQFTGHRIECHSIWELENYVKEFALHYPKQGILTKIDLWQDV